MGKMGAAMVDCPVGGTLPAAARALECFDEASQAGFGKDDATLLPARWANISAR